MMAHEKHESLIDDSDFELEPPEIAEVLN